VEVAGEAGLLGGGPGAQGEPLDVVELEPPGGAAEPTVLERPRALPTVPLPYLPPHGRRDVAAAPGRRRRSDGGGGAGGSGARRRSGGDLTVGRGRPLPRLRPDPATLAVPVDDEVEPELEELVVRDVRVGVRDRIAGCVELLEQSAGDRDVEAGQLGGERLDPRRLIASPRSWRHIGDGKLARWRFFRKNRTERERLMQDGHLGQGRWSRSGGHDRPHRRRLCRQERRPDLLRLAHAFAPWRAIARRPRAPHREAGGARGAPAGASRARFPEGSPNAVVLWP
jgi:hypothetical protein